MPRTEGPLLTKAQIEGLVKKDEIQQALAALNDRGALTDDLREVWHQYGAMESAHQSLVSPDTGTRDPKKPFLSDMAEDIPQDQEDKMICVLLKVIRSLDE